MINSHGSNKSQKLNFGWNNIIVSFIFAISLVMSGLFVSSALAKDVTIQWDTNQDADYYVVYWGDSSGNYSQHSDDIAAPATQYTAVDVPDSGTWHFAVKAFNSCGNSSDYSDEVVSSGSSEFLCSISSPSSEQSIMAGTSVYFQGSASGGSGSLEYLWDFGGSGAAQSFVEEPGMVLFSTAGVYTITLTVTDGDGDIVSDTVQINVASDSVPAAAISSPSSEQSVMAGNSVNFQGSASGGNGSLDYLWDFGGSGAGSRSVEDPGDVVFSTAGTFSVTFSVTDEDGDSVSDTVIIHVASDTVPAVAISSPSSERSIMAGTSVNFQGSASGGNGSLDYFWDFGGSGAGSRSVQDPGNIVFSTAGTFSVTFSVTDEDGDVVSDTVTINVASDTIPAATISSPSSEVSIMAGTPVNFQSSASGGNGPLEFLWDFDGSAASSSDEDPGNVIFSATGTYEVTLTVRDSDGDSVTDTVTIHVASDSVPAASIINPVATQSIMAGAFVSFQGHASGGNGSLTYAWDFDGGAASSSVEDPGNVTFSTAGTYDVAFTVSDSDGDVASDTVTINVASDSQPSASITGPTSAQTIIAGEAVNFQGTATGGDAPLIYTWDFESGAAQRFDEDPGSVYFSTTGIYSVSFSVTDSDGDVASDTIIVEVKADTAPSVEILSPGVEQSIVAGEMIDFQGDVSGGNTPLVYMWDFGSGPAQRSVEDPGNVIFSTAGTYEVSFSVTDSTGDVATDTVVVNVSEPVTPDPGSTDTEGPEPVYPDDDINVSLTPELQADISEPYGQSRWQISRFSDFSSIQIDITKKSDLSFLKVPMLVLKGGTKYYWRVKSNDTKGEASSWSETMSFSTTGDVAADTDSNGIPDSQEIDETIDLDFDGMADIFQDDIKCVRSVIADSQIIGIKKGAKVSGINLVESIDHREIEDTNGMPDEMPSGLIGFKVEVDNPGDTAELTVCFSEPAPDNAGWYKYDSIHGWKNYTSQVLFSSDRMSVAITLTDGGAGDADGAENGVIVDPGGLGIMQSVAPAVFPGTAEQTGCFIGSTGSFHSLTSGNSFFGFIFGMCSCCWAMFFIRKFQ